MSIASYTSWWAATTYALLSATCFLLLRFAGRPSSSRLASGRTGPIPAPVLALGVPLLVLAATAGFALRPGSPPRLEVTVLDVGQGDAILIETPDGADILIDGGPGRAVLRGLGDELAWYDRSIELMILTHPQADHLTGLVDVLDRYVVRRVLAVEGADSSILADDWKEAIDGEGIITEHPVPGSLFELGSGVRMEVFGPARDLAGDAKLNNTSIVVRITWRDVSFLLTGDIEAKAEHSLVARGVELRSTVLKVAHHGSATSSTAEFLEAVQPSVAVVSAGESNRFGHPREDVVDRLDDYAAVLTTAESGSVHFETDGKRLWISTTK
jgi:competence protein ComEC